MNNGCICCTVSYPFFVNNVDKTFLW
jgi:G3E family GTPase